MDSQITHTTPLYDLLGWLDTNKKMIIQVAGGVAVVAVVVSFLVWRSGQKELDASTALINLRMEARPGDNAGEALRKFAADNGSTAAGRHALLLAGGSLFADGKYADARTCFEQFLAKTPEGPLAMQASYGVATSLEAEGKAAEALPKYEAVARLGRELLAERSKLAIARIQLAQKKPEEALKIYRQLAGNASSAQAEAQIRADELLKLHPELNTTGTNAAPAMIGAPR